MADDSTTSAPEVRTGESECKKKKKETVLCEGNIPHDKKTTFGCFSFWFCTFLFIPSYFVFISCSYFGVYRL